MMLGQHALKTWRKTQSLLALSSGESEFYALCKSASRGLGMQALLEDLGERRGVTVLVDSTACKGVASRRGVGKIRHLHTQVLWVQAAVAEKRPAIGQVRGVDNMADLGTKHLEEAVVLKFLTKLGFVFRSGRSGGAPKLIAENVEGGGSG